jgi:hypothetical protein
MRLRGQLPASFLKTSMRYDSGGTACWPQVRIRL